MLGVEGIGASVWGLGSLVQGLGSGSRAWGLAFRIWAGLGMPVFRVWSLGFSFDACNVDRTTQGPSNRPTT